jgi:SAM-dependent methyltransferase
MSAAARYDRIGASYARTRQPDPALQALIERELRGARTVVDVGAGTGSYESRDRHVMAIEPSDVMAAQRPRELAPAIRASAGDLPLRDASVDAALAVLTIHHWDQERERGVRELRRVARGPVVIVTFDPQVSSRMWLAAEYVPEVAQQDLRIFPYMEELAGWLGRGTRVQPLPIAAATPDWTFGSLWAHPERVLDEEVLAGTSGFARLAPAVRRRAVEAVRRDLESGAWDARHGHLRTLEQYDAGMRLVVHRPQLEDRAG